MKLGVRGVFFGGGEWIDAETGIHRSGVGSRSGAGDGAVAGCGSEMWTKGQRTAAKIAAERLRAAVADLSLSVTPEERQDACEKLDKAEATYKLIKGLSSAQSSVSRRSDRSDRSGAPKASSCLSRFSQNVREELAGMIRGCSGRRS